MAVTYLTLYLPGSSQGIQVVEGSQLHVIYVAMGANSIPSAPGETVRQDPYPQYVDAAELAAALAAYTPGGGGAVDSVNGQTGVVVLDADDIGDGTANKAYTAGEQAKLAGVATAATANATDAALRDRATHTGTESITGAFAGATCAMVQNGDGTWPNRRTSRTDVTGIWLRTQAGSADPAAVTPPAVNGAYANDVTFGA